MHFNGPLSVASNKIPIYATINFGLMIITFGHSGINVFFIDSGPPGAGGKKEPAALSADITFPAGHLPSAAARWQHLLATPPAYLRY